MNQLELDAVPRKRVQLIADEPAAVEGGAGSGDGFVEAMLASKSNTEMAHALRRAANAVGSARLKAALTAADDRDDWPLSDWAEGAPPMTGWWDVKLGGLKGRDDGDRLWFSFEHQQWRTEEGYTLDDVILDGMVYRGLADPWPGGYPWEKARTTTRRVVLAD